MAVGVIIKFDAKSLQRLLTKLPDELATNIPNAGYNYTRKISKALRLAAITDPKRPITSERQMAASQIKAEKISKFKSVVKMPRSLIMLDSMNPHWVSLKRGRNITRWAKNNFGTATVSGKSYVYRGPKGAIKGGSLYVTPYRFVSATLRKQRNKLPNELRKGLNKAFKASKI